ncbi:outer membrane protein assembly factor BamE [Marinospirillum celere]|nr:outer membrane protein assembly factor BamE [Marinospirillum celere]
MDQESIDQLEIGMREDQVKYLLGSPLLTPLGEPNQWDYVYQLRRGQDLKARKRVTVFFEQSADNQLRVARIDRREDQINVENLDQLTPSAEIGAPAAEEVPTPPGQPDPQQTEPQQPPQQ